MKSASSQKPESNAFLEKDVIGVTEFIKETGVEGAGVTVAVIDTGVDPRAYGLRETSDGRVKVADMLDLTGDGDVSMKQETKAVYPSEQEAKNSSGDEKGGREKNTSVVGRQEISSDIRTKSAGGNRRSQNAPQKDRDEKMGETDALKDRPYVMGLSGRKLFLSRDITELCPTGQFRLGLKDARSFWPQELITKFDRKRRKVWDAEWRKAEEAIRRQQLKLHSSDEKKKHDDSKAEEKKATGDQKAISADGHEDTSEETGNEKVIESLSADDSAKTKEPVEVSRQSEDKEKIRKAQITRKNKLRKKKSKCLRKTELHSQLKFLEHLRETYNDTGPVFDCITFCASDGKWRAVVDTSECGELEAAPILCNYREKHETGTFAKYDHLTFGVNIYEKGKLLSIVVNGSDHGTAVAGAIGAYCSNEPNLCGIAPSAQIISLKISDGRFDGDLAIHAQLRALSCLTSLDGIVGDDADQTRQHKVEADVVNMSYGGPSRAPGVGHLAEITRRLSRERNILFVGVAGNDGPALSTIDGPGGTDEAVLSVGSFMTKSTIDQLYPSIGISEYFNVSRSSNIQIPNGEVLGTTLNNIEVSKVSSAGLKEGHKESHEPASHAGSSGPVSSVVEERKESTLDGVEGLSFTYSGRGPSPDGQSGVSICAPGAALLPLPQWKLSSKEPFHGTSCAAPCCAGSIALLLSYLKHKSLPYNSTIVRRSIENTAKPLLLSCLRDKASDPVETAAEFFDGSIHYFSQGFGALHVAGARRYLDNLYASKLGLNNRKQRLKSTKTTSDTNDNWNAERSLGVHGYLEAIRVSVLTQVLHPNGSFAPFQSGIYIRKIPPSAGAGTIRAKVTLKPHVDVQEYSPIKTLALTELEVVVALKATTDWVKCPSSVLLTGTKQEFTVLLNTSVLKAGKVYEAEIHGTVEDAKAKQQIILFRVPITVILAERELAPLGDSDSPLRLDLGSIVRKFISPPSGATYCTIEAKACSNYGYTNVVTEGRLLRIVCAQLSGRESFSLFAETLHEETFCVKPGDTFAITCPIVCDIPLEVCLAQLWSSFGKTLLEYVHFSFGGLKVSKPSVHIGRAQTSESLTIFNRLEGPAASKGDYEPVARAAVRAWFICIRREEVPTTSSIEPLGFRDVLPEDRYIYSLKLEYSTQVPRDGDVAFWQPGFKNELPTMLQGGTVSLYTKNKKFLKSKDFGRSVEMPALKSGEYIVLLEVRHNECSVLEELRNLRLTIDFDLKEKEYIYTEAYLSEQGAALQKKSDRVSNQCLEPGDQLQVWFGADASRMAHEQHKWVRDGDQVVGCFKVDQAPYSEAKLHFVDSPEYQIICEVSVPCTNDPDLSDCSDCSVSEAEDADGQVLSKMEESSKSAKLDYLHSCLKAQEWKRFDEGYGALSRYLTSIEDDFTLKMYRLHLERHLQEEKSLRNIMSAARSVLALDVRATEIIGTLDAYSDLKHHFNRKKEVEKMTEQSDAVIAAYYAVCKSLLNEKLEGKVVQSAEMNQNGQSAASSTVESGDTVEKEKEGHGCQDSDTEKKDGVQSSEKNLGAEGQSTEHGPSRKEEDEELKRLFEQGELEDFWMGMRKWMSIKSRIATDGETAGISSDDWRKLLIKREIKRERLGTALKYLKETKDEEDAELKIKALRGLGWTFQEKIEMNRKRLEFPKEYLSFWGHS